MEFSPRGPAIQDQISGNHCFGCGPDNTSGLNIKSFWMDGERAVCQFQPSPHHAAGPASVVNGGIIATLIDCHGIATAIADAYERTGRSIGSLPILNYVTGGLEIRYLRPAPLGQPLMLQGRVAEAHDRKTLVDCELRAGDVICATGTVIAVRMPDSWSRR